MAKKTNGMQELRTETVIGSMGGGGDFWLLEPNLRACKELGSSTFVVFKEDDLSNFIRFDNTNLWLNNSSYPARPHSIIVY